MGSRSDCFFMDAEFNDFLFAFVGEEENGVELTVLSALARLGLDPWGEAANLSKLTREAATSALAAKIAALPDGHWKESDIRSIAGRLVDFLPRHASAATKSPEDRRGGHSKPQSEAQKWLIWAVLAGALFMALARWFGD